MTAQAETVDAGRFDTWRFKWARHHIAELERQTEAVESIARVAGLSKAQRQRLGNLIERLTVLKGWEDDGR